MRDKAMWAGRMSGDAGAIRKCEVKTLMTSGHSAFQVHSSWYGRPEFGRSSWKGHNTGHNKNTPVQCPCSRLATLHGAPRTHC